VLKLLIQDDEGRKTLVPFSRDEITIGREDGNTIRLTERNVSRRHARLFRHSTQIFIEDLKSHNGIHVNGRRIRGQAVIRKGDIIAIGDYDILLEGSPSTPPLPPQRKTEPLAALQTSPPALEQLPPQDALPQQPLLELFPPDETLPPFLEPTPSPPADFAASVAYVDTFDVEGNAHKNFSGSQTSASSRQEVDAFVSAHDSEQGRLFGERPTIQLPEFTELPESQSPRLVALNLDLRGREFLCCRSEFSLGYSEINDLVLKHNSVAPIHCRIERDENNQWFVALDPRYPVFVNGETCQPFPLENGDILTLGKQELKFFLPPSLKAPPPPPPQKKKAQASLLLPFGIGLFLAFLVALAFLYAYWSIGALHESALLPIRSFAQQFLPLPPSIKPKPKPEPEKKPPPENTPAPVPLEAVSPPPEIQGVIQGVEPEKHAPLPLGTPQLPDNAPPAPKVAPYAPSKTHEPSPPKADRALEKATGRPSAKTMPPPPARKASRETSSAAFAESPEAETSSPPPQDQDLFWEHVDDLKKKANEEVAAAARRATLSSLHTKLSTCNSAQCAYELAKTSLDLSNMGSTPATARYPGEFEAYLRMRDPYRQARARREDACNILLNHYNSTGNLAKVKALSEICAR